MTPERMVNLHADNRVQGAANVSDKRPDYDQITFHVPKGQREVIKRLAKEKSGLSLSSHIKMLLERDLGIEIDMETQVADNTGRRKTG